MHRGGFSPFLITCYPLKLLLGGGLGLQIASVSLPLVCLHRPAAVRLLGRLATTPHLPQLCTRLGSALLALDFVRIGH